MPKNIKEEILVLKLCGKEKAIVGTYAKKSFLFFFSRQGWSWQAQCSFGCKEGGDYAQPGKMQKQLVERPLCLN